MVGRLARSKAGHDRERLYLIVREEGEFLWLADGVTRSLTAPKKKRRRHVQPAGMEFTESQMERFFENPAWADNMIRERIKEVSKRMQRPKTDPQIIEQKGSEICQKQM